MQHKISHFLLQFTVTNDWYLILITHISIQNLLTGFDKHVARHNCADTAGDDALVGGPVYILAERLRLKRRKVQGSIRQDMPNL